MASNASSNWRKINATIPLYWRDAWTLAIVLMAGLAHGLIYVYLIPPWQHYDEPNHFEYAWLIANRGRLPKQGEFDQEMRRQTAVSMVEHGFFKGMRFLPDLEAKDKPIWIGSYSQLSDPPLYYLGTALPLMLRDWMGITSQLYAARWVSLILYLVTILSAWGMTRELTGVGHPLRLVVPISVVMLPAFTDMMTAVNNEAGGVALFSVSLWACLRLMRRGFHWLSFLGAGAAALACVWTAVMAATAPFIVAVATMFSIFRGSKRWIVWAAMAAGIPGFVLIAFAWGDAASWYRASMQDENTQLTTSKAVLGENAFQVDVRARVSPAWSPPVFQPVGQGLPAGRYTLGAWMWSDPPLSARSPLLGTSEQTFSRVVELSEVPIFVTVPITIETSARRGWVSLDPRLEGQENGVVYYDGLVLAEGERPEKQTPIYADAEASRGIWGDRVFVNVLRNASAEKAGWRARSWVDEFSASVLPDQTMLSTLAAYLTDWQGISWHYWLVSRTLLRSFWATFGWGHVPLMNEKSYRWLVGLTVAGFAGAMFWVLTRFIGNRRIPLRIKPSWAEYVFLLMVLLVVWGGAFTRGIGYLTVGHMYIPLGRYAYPAVVPIMMIIAGGLWFLIGGVFRKLKPWLPRTDLWALGSYLLIFVTLDVYSILSIAHYYASLQG